MVERERTGSKTCIIFLKCKPEVNQMSFRFFFSCKKLLRTNGNREWASVIWFFFSSKPKVEDSTVKKGGGRQDRETERYEEGKRLYKAEKRNIYIWNCLEIAIKKCRCENAVERRKKRDPFRTKEDIECHLSFFSLKAKKKNRTFYHIVFFRAKTGNK